MSSNLPCLLDGPIPYSMLEKSAFALLSCKQLPSESVLIYTIRFRALLCRFEELVELVTPGRAPFQALKVIVFQRGLPRAIQCLKQLPGPIVTSVREAVELARRDEAFLTAYADDPEVLFRPSTHPRYRVLAEVLSQQQQERQRRQRSSHHNGNGGRRRGKGGRRRKGRRRRAQRRPLCTHPGCQKPLGHTVETCFQKQREENPPPARSRDDRHISKKLRRERS